MARLPRSWHPVMRSYVDSAKLNRVSLQAEALYMRLLVSADRRGVYHGDPFDVASRLLTQRLRTARATVDQVRALMDELGSVGLIGYFRDGDEDYLFLVNYTTCNEARSPVFPAPPGYSEANGDAASPKRGRPVPDSGTPCPPNGGNQDQEQEQEQEHQQEQTPPTPPAGGTRRKRPRVDGKAELASWIESQDPPLRSDLIEACEAFRAGRVSRRHKPLTARQWSKHLEAAQGDQGALIAALLDADRQGWQGVFPKPKVQETGSQGRQTASERAIDSMRAAAARLQAKQDAQERLRLTGGEQ